MWGRNVWHRSVFPPVQAALTGLGGGRGYSKSVAKEDIERLLREKHTLKEVAHLLNISRPTLYKMLRKYRLDSAFKFMTNEQIMHLMRGIVTEFPQAAVDVEVMLEKLNQRSIFSINPKRVLACLKKLNSDWIADKNRQLHSQYGIFWPY